MKSKPYKIGKHLFRYDFTHCVVENIAKADEDDIKLDKEWKETHGYSLLDIDVEGYMILSVAGLSKENWRNKAARKEYLNEWIADIEEECSALAADFVKNELPLYV